MGARNLGIAVFNQLALNLSARADRVLGRVKLVNGDVLGFSSTHILRVLGARRWLGLETPRGRTILAARHDEHWALGYARARTGSESSMEPHVPSGTVIRRSACNSE